MTTPSPLHAHTAIAIQLLRLLAKGVTMEQMERRVGLTHQSIYRRLAILEAAGVPIQRPAKRGRGSEPGQYILAPPELRRAILAYIDPPI